MRKYFITGLLVLVPLVITAWVLNLIISTLDQSLLFVPDAWQPRTMFGMDVPGFGAVLTLAIVFLTGHLTNNLVGKYIVRLGERLLKRVPVVSSLYGSVKQVSDTLFSPSGNALSKSRACSTERRCRVLPSSLLSMREPPSIHTSSR